MIKNLNFDAAAATFFYKKIIKQIKFIIILLYQKYF